MALRLYILVPFFILLIAPYLSRSVVIGNATLYAPAVDLTNNTGILTKVSLYVTNGDGNIAIKGPISVGSSTYNASKTAVYVASRFLGVNPDAYNFTYIIYDNNSTVSGPSIGAAFTILAISALSHKPFRINFSVTGTIEPNGSIGLIGGVYDKASAVKSNGIDIFFVPYASNRSFEYELYYLVSRTFGIKLIELPNISVAYNILINGSPISNYSKYIVNFNPYVNYNVEQIRPVNISCSSCNLTGFYILTNQTFNITLKQLDKLREFKNYTGLYLNYSRLINETYSIRNNSYLYTADDINFLNFINIFTFNNNFINISSGRSLLLNTYAYCLSLQQPNPTYSNIDYLYNGELRQMLGMYVVNTSLSIYNSSVQDTDGAIRIANIAGEALGWCDAADTLYNLNYSGAPVQFNSNIVKTAYSYITNVSGIVSPYSYVAIEAYRQGNYPLAILASAYAISFNSSIPSNLSINSIESIIDSMKIDDSFAYEFAKQAYFYIQEAEINKNNSSLYNTYMADAYTSARLAYNINNAINIIRADAINSSVGVSNQSIRSLDLQIYQIGIYIKRLAYLIILNITLSFILFILIIIILTNNRRKSSRV
ncbi:MAG: lon protease [Candidatus Micrarchaeota archaeon]|nr:MAG: lon protease [Candidatus Micrarchaeota archaeon]